MLHSSQGFEKNGVSYPFSFSRYEYGYGYAVFIFYENENAKKNFWENGYEKENAKKNFGDTDTKTYTLYSCFSKP